MEHKDVIKIIIVGNYSIFRVALRMLLETSEKFKIVAEFASVSEISTFPNLLNSNLILVDLPEDGEATEIIASLSQYIDKIPILILVGSNNARVFQQCLRSGINGLVLKEKNEEILFKAVELVSRGEYWFDRSTMRETIRDLIYEKNVLSENTGSAIQNNLTEREKEVIGLVCKGMRNKEIAAKLFVTETTIRHHLTSVFEKLNLTSRLELVIYSFENSLVELPKVISLNSNSLSSKYTPRTE